MSKAASPAMAPKQQVQRVLFARVGSMILYNGPDPDDERPRGGGAYNESNVGHELFNFANFSGRLYGFVRAKAGRLKLERIDPAASASAAIRAWRR